WYAVVGHLTLPWSVEGNEPALGRVFRAAEGTHRYGRAALRPAPPRESENHPAVIRDGLRPAVYGRSPYVLYSSATFGDSAVAAARSASAPTRSPSRRLARPRP